MGKGASGASLASAKPFVPSISPPPRTPRLAVPEAQADPGPAGWWPQDQDHGGVTGVVAKGPEREDRATRGHKYDRNTSGDLQLLRFNSPRGPQNHPSPPPPTGAPQLSPSRKKPSPGGPGPTRHSWPWRSGCPWPGSEVWVLQGAIW